MFETMYNADGVGLAAPQVGLSIRLVVIDGDVMGDDFPECKGFKRALINPEFLERKRFVGDIGMRSGRSTRKWWKVSPPVSCSMSASI